MADAARDVELSAGRLLLAEFHVLKEEQRQRIGVRDNLIYATLAAMAATTAASFRGIGGAGVLLLLPPVCLVLGWTYLMNDQKVSAIGRYIRHGLAPRMADLVPDGVPIFGWEAVHRAETGRRARKLMQLGVELLLFGLSGLTAIIAFLTIGPRTPLLIMLSVVELVAVVGLMIQFAVQADLRAGAGDGD